MLKERNSLPLAAAAAAIPKATGSAPAVSPPIAVISSGIISNAASAISNIPSGRHAVCFASQNQELFRPHLRVKSPVLIE